MSWSLPAGGQVRAVLFGGGFRVDLHDLDTLAAQLSGGAGLLDEAARHLGAAHAQIEAGSHPFAYELTPWDLAADPMAAEWQRAQAIQAADALRTGPGSVAQVAELLQTLSTDVLASAEAYQNAEARNATSWQTSVQILHNVSLVQALGGGTSLALSLARLLAASPRLRELMDDTVFHGLQDLVNEAPEGTVKDGLADLSLSCRTRTWRSGCAPISWRSSSWGPRLSVRVLVRRLHVWRHICPRLPTGWTRSSPPGSLGIWRWVARSCRPRA